MADRVFSSGVTPPSSARLRSRPHEGGVIAEPTAATRLGGERAGATGLEEPLLAVFGDVTRAQTYATRRSPSSGSRAAASQVLLVGGVPPGEARAAHSARAVERGGFDAESSAIAGRPMPRTPPAPCRALLHETCRRSRWQVHVIRQRDYLDARQRLAELAQACGRFGVASTSLPGHDPQKNLRLRRPAVAYLVRLQACALDSSLSAAAFASACAACSDSMPRRQSQQVPGARATAACAQPSPAASTRPPSPV